jgi:hypothetical protein
VEDRGVGAGGVVETVELAGAEQGRMRAGLEVGIECERLPSVGWSDRKIDFPIKALFHPPARPSLEAGLGSSRVRP